MNFFYFMVAKIFYSLGYFYGSSRILMKISASFPLKVGWFKHPLGFSWMISSRDALSTYLSSCEPFTTKLVLSRVANLDSFICVGANRGWYPLVVGARNKKIQIVSFECNSVIYDELKQNILQNSNQSKLNHLAISDYFGEADLFMPINGNDGMSTLYPVGGRSQNASRVECVSVTTLDSCLFDEFATLGRLLILMDIEGSEMMALKGASQLIQNCSPTLILEINADMLVAAGSSSGELFQYLRAFNYEAYWIDERGNLVQVVGDNQLPHVSILPPRTGANYLFAKAGDDWVKEFNKA